MEAEPPPVPAENPGAVADARVPVSGGEAFTTTHWSLVLAAGRGGSESARAALEILCRTYWYPVYAFIRRRGYGAEDAEDLAQGFFARLLSRQILEVANPLRGRFRGFLLTAVKNHLANEWDRAHAVKRGGGAPTIGFDQLQARDRFAAEAATPAPPDALFERAWAMTLLERVKDRLRAELAKVGHADRFAWLEPMLAGDRSQGTCADLARRIGLTPMAVRSELHRARARFRLLLRHEIARTVGSPEDIDDEIQHLRRVLAR